MHNQRAFIAQLVKRLNINSTEEWWTLSQATLHAHGGAGLVKKYGGSTIHLLTTVYPEYKQACRDTILNLVQKLKLSSVAELLKVHTEYPLHSSINVHHPKSHPCTHTTVNTAKWVLHFAVYILQLPYLITQCCPSVFLNWMYPYARDLVSHKDIGKTSIISESFSIN